MPRNISTDQRNAFKDWHCVIAFFIELGFTSGTLRYTNMLYDITWGGNTWLGMGMVGRIDPIKENTNLSAQGLKISVTGVEPAMISLALQEPMQGRPVKVYIGVLNKDTYQIIGTPILEYTGILNVPMIEDEDGAAINNSHTGIVSIQAEGRLADMFRPNVRRYTNADQQKVYPNDKFFEFMPQMTEKIAIWPGKGWQPK